MTPSTYNFSVVRGTSAIDTTHSPLVMRFKRGGIPIPFEDARLSVYSKHGDPEHGALLFRASLLEGGLVETNEYEGEISWMATTEETRLLLVGTKNYYEMELREDGNEQVYILGVISGIGGLNDDEGS